MKRDITIKAWVLLLIVTAIAVASWFVSKQVHRCRVTPVDTRHYDSQMIEARYRVKELDKESDRQKAIVDRNTEKADQLKKKRQNNTSTNYEKVTTAPDSLQHAIFCELSARMRQFRSEGY